jgi:hypothetical protein
MVKLVGVCHGGYYGDLWAGGSQLSVRPSEQFLKWLGEFPVGTKVGLETLSIQDFEEVRIDLAKKFLKRLTAEHEQEYLTQYGSQDERYWNFLRVFCMERGMKVILLDSKKAYFKYNDRMVESQKQKANIKTLFHDEGESELDYLRKLCLRNDAKYVAEIKSREAHEIHRERKILEAIAQSEVDVAVIGEGHAAIFADESENEKYPIKVEEHNTDLIMPSSGGEHRMTFTKNAEPLLSEIVGRKSLLGALNLIRNGRITPSMTPDYVGVWDMHFPFKGYFEVFLDSANKFSGIMHDSIGPASFCGELNEGGVSFVKKYLIGMERRDITYKGFRFGEDFFGYYCVGNSGGAVFCMTKAQRAKPLDLCLLLEQVGETRGEDFKALLEQFKNPPINLNTFN